MNQEFLRGVAATSGACQGSHPGWLLTDTGSHSSRGADPWVLALPPFSAPGVAKHKSKQLQQLQQLQQFQQLQQLQQLQQAQHARPHMHSRQPSLGHSGLPPSRPQSAQTADSNSGSFLLAAWTLSPSLPFLPGSPLFRPRLETARARELRDEMGGRIAKTQLRNVWYAPGL